ncbi:hypothetical protein HOY80DRAFT_1008340 [Tuber brumale]|nr:hypothetical protein HOY80DRAFT_1008340 [Tuber brumale]
MPPLLEYSYSLPETSSPAAAPSSWLLASGLHLNPAHGFIASRYSIFVSYSCPSLAGREDSLLSLGSRQAPPSLDPAEPNMPISLFYSSTRVLVYHFPQKLLHQTSYAPFLSPMTPPVKWRYTRVLGARRPTTTNHMLRHLGQTYHRFTLGLCSNTTGRERRMQEANIRRPGERISEHFLYFSPTAGAQTVT